MQKNWLLLLFCGCFAVANLNAQHQASGINYQAVARDSKGQVLSNKTLQLQISLFAGETGGKAAYRENHSIKTGDLGVFSLVVGQGEVVAGDFREVPWQTMNIWMELALDEAGGKNFSPIHASQLMVVPYAFHALTADELTKESGIEKTAAFWKVNGNVMTIPGANFLGTIDAKDLVVKTNNVERIRVEASGNVQVTNQLEAASLKVRNAYTLPTNSGVNGQVLTSGGNGQTAWQSVADNSPTNELQALSRSGNMVSLSQNGGTVSIDDADADPTNELQTISKTGSVVTLSQNGGSFTDAVDDADASPTNELQTLSFSNNQLSISSGNTIDFPALSSDLWSQSGDHISNSNLGNVEIVKKLTIGPFLVIDGESGAGNRHYYTDRYFRYVLYSDNNNNPNGIGLIPDQDNFGGLGAGGAYWDDAHITEIRYHDLFNTSDARTKKNLRPIASAVAKLQKINGLTYDIDLNHPLYKSVKPEERERYKNHMGFTAQNLMEVFPDMVLYNKEEGVYQVRNQYELEAVIVEAVKEQQAQIEALQKENAELRQLTAKMAELEARLQKLEK